jgi:hypothetical protein
VSSTVPCTLVVARLSSFERRHDENREVMPGSLTTTRGDLDCPPDTVVERADPSATVVPPSTIDVCGSQIVPDLIVLATGVPGAQGSLL